MIHLTCITFTNRGKQIYIYIYIHIYIHEGVLISS